MFSSLKTCDLGEHHQVLAYGYDLSGNELILWIYDPNEHHNDNMIMKLNIANPEHALNIEYKGNKKIFCFFQTNYTFSMPPASTASPGRIIMFEDENFCGKSIEIVREHADLSTHKMGNFNNRTSSFVILSGEWSFFLNTGFDSPVLRNGTPLQLGPGAYRRATDFGIQDNEITSLKAVNSPNLTLSRNGSWMAHSESNQHARSNPITSGAPTIRIALARGAYP